MHVNECDIACSHRCIVSTLTPIVIYYQPKFHVVTTFDMPHQTIEKLHAGVEVYFSHVFVCVCVCVVCVFEIYKKRSGAILALIVFKSVEIPKLVKNRCFIIGYGYN